MRQSSRSKWPYLALAGIGLIAVPIVVRTLAASRRDRENRSDNAPGHTARRSFGEYGVVGRSVTIRKPRAELFGYWRQFENLTTVMESVEAVAPHDDVAGRSTWTLRSATGQQRLVEVDIVREIDGELIAWRSTPESDIDTEGRITFEDAPGERGTRVGLIIAFKPRGGSAGQALAKLLRKSPELQARHDLKRFKMLMETGEIATSRRTGSSPVQTGMIEETV